jgi:predicted nucleic acid-binding Zn ribbon protein
MRLSWFKAGISYLVRKRGIGMTPAGNTPRSLSSLHEQWRELRKEVTQLQHLISLRFVVGRKQNTRKPTPEMDTMMVMLDWERCDCGFSEEYVHWKKRDATLADHVADVVEAERITGLKGV